MISKKLQSWTRICKRFSQSLEQFYILVFLPPILYDFSIFSKFFFIYFYPTVKIMGQKYSSGYLNMGPQVSKWMHLSSSILRNFMMQTLVDVIIPTYTSNSERHVQLSCFCLEGPDQFELILFSKKKKNVLFWWNYFLLLVKSKTINRNKQKKIFEKGFCCI